MNFPLKSGVFTFNFMSSIYKTLGLQSVQLHRKQTIEVIQFIVQKPGSLQVLINSHAQDCILITQPLMLIHLHEL